MRYRLFTTSLKAWDAMLSAIKEAKKSIYLESYIFSDDTQESHDFIGCLEKKAEDGLRVIVVVDAYGSKALKNKIEKINQRSKIEFLFFSHWLRHIHRKVLLVDEKIAFIGGVNIGRRFRHWNDLQLKLSGKIVQRLLKSFAYTYEMANGKNPAVLAYRQKKSTKKIKFWLVEHWPIKNIYSLKKHYIEKINSAQENILIATPYFTPPRWLISLLDNAVRRGVSVEILIPQKVDWKIMDLLNYRFMSNLHLLGIKFFISPTMNHSKLLIIDQKEALVGSQNIDLFSFSLNSEVGVFFSNKKLLRELLAVVALWKKQSSHFHPQRHKLSLADYFILAILKVLRPIL